MLDVSTMAGDTLTPEQEAAKEATLEQAVTNARQLSNAQDDNPKLVRDLLNAQGKLADFRNTRMQRQISLLLASSQDRQEIAKKGAKKYVPQVPDYSGKLARHSSSLHKKKKKEAEKPAEQQEELEADTGGGSKEKRVTRASLADSDDCPSFSEDEEEEEILDSRHDSGVRISATVPAIKEGCTFKEYQELVEIWSATVHNKIAKQQQALLLLAELPNTEKSGSLRSRVKDRVGLAKLQTTNGVAHLLAAIRHYKDAPSFVRLVAWMKSLIAFKQKPNWSNDNFVFEFRKLTKIGEEEFDITLPAGLRAAYLLTTCTDISIENLNIITHGIELGHEQVDRQVEKAMKKWTSSRQALGGGSGQKGAKSAGSYTVTTDLLGNEIQVDVPDPQSGGATGGPQHVNVASILAKPAERRNAKDWNMLREDARKNGKCTTCFDKRHKAEDCPDKEKEAARINALKMRVLKTGGSWNNRDGTWLVGPPPGTIVNEDPKKKASSTRPADAAQFSSSAISSDPAPAYSLQGVQIVNQDRPITYNLQDLAFDPSNLTTNSYTASSPVQVNVPQSVMFTSNDPAGIVDSGCARTNGGTPWFNSFYNSMNEEDKALTRTYDSPASFKYGDSSVFASSL